MAHKIRRWDAADTLQSKRDVGAYLAAVLEDGDPELLKAALADISRAKALWEKLKQQVRSGPARFRK